MVNKINLITIFVCQIQNPTALYKWLNMLKHDLLDMK